MTSLADLGSLDLAPGERVHVVFDPRALSGLHLPSALALPKRDLRESIPAGKGRIDAAEYLARVRRGQLSGMQSMMRLIDAHPGATVCIVGGGPTLQDNVGELRRLAKRGAIIIGVNKSHDWLLKRGLPCHYAMLLDPKEWVADYITLDISRETIQRAGKLWVEPRYLIASQCHDKTIEKFRTHPRAYLYHAGAGLGESKMLREEFPAPCEWVNVPGASVSGLRAAFIAHGLGGRDLHLFGIDGSSKPPTEPEARAIYAALVEAGMVKAGDASYDDILGMLFELARRRNKLPEAVSDILKRHHYSYAKPHIDVTWCGFTVDLNTGWSRNFMANHHMSRAVYEFEDSMKDWDRLIRKGKLDPFRLRVHGDPEVSAIAMVAAGMGVHFDVEQNEKYGKPPKEKRDAEHAEETCDEWPEAHQESAAG